MNHASLHVSLSFISLKEVTHGDEPTGQPYNFVVPLGLFTSFVLDLHL